MITWHIGIKSVLSVETSDGQIDYFSEWYQGDEIGTRENNVLITVYSDGSMSILDKGNYEDVQLYPEQVEHLREILRNMEEI